MPKNKKNVRILIFLLLPLLIGCASKADVKNEPEALPMLWEIEGENTSYLLGTIHLPDERVTDLPDIVDDKFNAADIYVMEAEMDPAAMMELTQYMMLPEGKTLKELMSAELYQKVSEILKAKGQDLEMFKTMKPWVLFSLIIMPAGLEEQPMDMALYSEAMSKGKETGGLESIKEQVMIFDDLTLEEQIQMLEKNVNEYEQFDQILEKMVALYVQGDIEGLTSYLNEELVDEESMDLYDNLITKRNYRMAERMGEFLEKGNAFVAVGAGHLGGEEGILKLMMDKGYKITRCKHK